MSKYSPLSTHKQAFWLESQLEKMENDFMYMLQTFGKDYAVKIFGSNNRQRYERLSCIKDCLEKFATLQANLDTVSPSLLQKLTENDLSEEEILDAIVSAMHSGGTSKSKGMISSQINTKYEG